jgi:EF hand
MEISMNKLMIRLVAAVGLLVATVAPAAQAVGGDSRSASQDQAAAVLTNNDLNEDGVVTKAEATSAGGRLIGNWDKVDLNKDGKVDKAEITKNYASIQQSGNGGDSRSAPQDQAAAVLTNNDLNEDGVVTKAEATSAGGRLIGNWDKVDLNRDGKVDKAEITKNYASIQQSSGGVLPGSNSDTGTSQPKPAAGGTSPAKK